MAEDTEAPMTTLELVQHLARVVERLCTSSASKAMAEDLEARLNATLELVQSLTRTVQLLANRVDDLHEQVERQQTGHAKPWSATAQVH